MSSPIRDPKFPPLVEISEGWHLKKMQRFLITSGGLDPILGVSRAHEIILLGRLLSLLCTVNINL